MPPVAAVVAEHVAGWVATWAFSAGLTLGASLSVYGAVYSGLYYATNIFLINKALGILNKRGKTGESAGLEVQINDTNASAIVVYGEVRMSGVNIIPPVTSGSDGRYLHQVLAHAAHEIDSFQAHYFDQETLPAPAAVTGSSGDGAISSGKYSGAAWVRGYTGTLTQTVDYILNAAFSSQWVATARGRGFAYTALKYDWGDGSIYNGIPSPTFLIRGAKVYDPRLDSTNGGSGTHRYNDSSTWAWSANPALCWANNRIADHGYAADPATDVNWATVAAAADICDASVDDKDGGSRARYTCNGLIVNQRDNLLDNEQKIIDCMLGRRTFVNGQWCIYAGAWTAPLWSIARSDWLSIDSIITADQSGRFSETHCFFVDPNRNWQRVECYVHRNATYLADDAGRADAIEMEQPMCTDESEAQMKAEFVLRASRNGVKLVGTLPPRFHKISTYDTVSATFDELGWDSKTFRVVSMSLNPDGSVRVALSEEQSADWTDLATADFGVPSLSSVPATNPTTPSAVTTISTTARPGAIDVAWDKPVVWPRGSFFRVLRASVNSLSSASQVWQGDALGTVETVANTSTYYHWLRSVGPNGSYNTLPGAGSGYPGNGLLVDTGNVAPGAISRITEVSCTTAQVFSKGAGAFLGLSIATLDPGTYANDATISIVATFRAGLGAIFGRNGLYLRYLNSVGSDFVVSSFSTGGSTTDPRPTTMQGIVQYTAATSTQFQLNWDTTSGPNDFVMDSMNMTATVFKR